MFFSFCFLPLSPFSSLCIYFAFRGANDVMLDEMERSLHDALSIVKRTLESGSVVAGGGAVEAALSIYLENCATTLGSREQLAIAEYPLVPSLFLSFSHILLLSSPPSRTKPSGWVDAREPYPCLVDSLPSITHLPFLLIFSLLPFSPLLYVFST